MAVTHSVDAEVGDLEQVLGRALDDRDEELGDEAEDLETLARALDAREELGERGVGHAAGSAWTMERQTHGCPSSHSTVLPPAPGLLEPICFLVKISALNA